jgi:hypothetical protein
MARRQPAVELDESLIEAARAVAQRSGVPESELYERALRDVLTRDFTELMDEIAEYQSAKGLRVGDDEAMWLADEELRAVRGGRRERIGGPRGVEQPDQPLGGAARAETSDRQLEVGARPLVAGRFQRQAPATAQVPSFGAQAGHGPRRCALVAADRADVIAALGLGVSWPLSL